MHRQTHQMKATPPRTTHQTPPRETSTLTVAMPQPQPTRQWPTEQWPTEQRQTEQWPTEQRQTEQRQTEQRQTEQRQTEQNSPAPTRQP